MIYGVPSFQRSFLSTKLCLCGGPFLLTYITYSTQLMIVVVDDGKDRIASNVLLEESHRN